MNPKNANGLDLPQKYNPSRNLQTSAKSSPDPDLRARARLLPCVPAVLSQVATGVVVVGRVGNPAGPERIIQIRIPSLEPAGTRRNPGGHPPEPCPEPAGSG